MKLFLSVHNDDETLFGAFTIMREKPLVVVVFDSYIQVARGADFCDCVTRRQETIKALMGLMPVSLGDNVKFCGLRDDTEYSVKEITGVISNQIPHDLDELPEVIYAPAFEENGHNQHNAVALAADVFARDGITVKHYTTYTRTGGKTRTDKPVPIEDPEWIERKLRALSEYRSQIRHPDCQEHFLRSQEEYYL